MKEDFILEDEDVVGLLQKDYISKLNFDAREILDIEDEEFIDLASVISLLNGISTNPVYVMRCLLKISICLKLSAKRATAELEDKEVILNSQIAGLKFSYSLQSDSNPYHGKLKITIESLNSLIDMNNSVTALRRTLLSIKHKRDVIYALCDLVEKEIDIAKAIMYLITSNPELKQTVSLSGKEIDDITKKAFTTLKIKSDD